MTKKTEKGRFFLELTPRENEVLDSLAELKKFQIDSKKELFHRGLHSARQLVEVDEKALMRLLIEKLESDPRKNAEYIKALTSTIYATLIAKQGIRGAEIFQSIQLTCRYIDLIGTGKIDEKQLYSYLKNLPTTIRTFFLSDSIDMLQNENDKVPLRKEAVQSTH